MNSYTRMPDDAILNTIVSQYASIRSGTKEFYLIANYGRQLPMFIKCINYYLNQKNIGLYISNTLINRNSGLSYELGRLNKITNINDPEYGTPNLLFNKATREEFGLKETYGLHVVNVTGQVIDWFDNYIPKWTANSDVSEILGVSLALKLTPKHRIRVYKRNNHIVVFTNKPIADTSYDENYDYKLWRKLYACLPILFGWTDAEDKHIEETTLLRSLEADNANNFFNLLINTCNNIPAIRDLKYKDIIDTFNSINTLRLNSYVNKSNEYANALELLMKNYSATLTAKRECDKTILDLETNLKELDTPTIKTLTDKKICYNLYTSQLNSTTDSRLSYRCSAPVIGFDKNAAQRYYERRVKNCYSKTLDTIYKLLFFDEKVILNFDEEIVLNFSRNTISAKPGGTIYGNDLNICFPNPHHYYHNCWGSYGPTVLKLLSEYKLEELFYQIKVAVGSLNFTDYIVLNEFISMMNNIISGRYNPAVFYWTEENCSTLHTLSDTLAHFTEEETE